MREPASVWDIALPVLTGTRFSAEDFHISPDRTIFGTAFPIGGGAFLTAEHVIANAAATGEQLLLARPDRGTRHMMVGEAMAEDRWPDIDVGVVRCPDLDLAPLDWHSPPLAMLMPVRGVGYPYAFDLDTSQFITRGFGGSVVSTRRYAGLAARPAVYELSFSAPRGLSGGPLLLGLAGSKVCGCIIANMSTKIPVLADEERVVEERRYDGVLKRRVDHVERYEVLHLGLAIRADEILGRRLMSGVTVTEHLVQHGAKV